MATADPTNELIRSLSDPAKFERVEGVVVFRAHERDVKLPDGKTRKVKVTDADLPGIAARLNEELARTGQLAPLTVGHRRFDPNFPEHLQPPLVGFARNYRVEWVEREADRFLAVVEDEYVMQDQRKVLRQYPYRSIDYDVDGKVSVGTALLIRPPFLKMGTVCVYQAESKNMPGDLTAAEDFTPDEIAGYERMCRYMKKTYPKLAQYMDAMGPMNAAPPAPAEPLPNNAALTPAQLAQYAADRAVVDDLKRRLDAAEVAQRQAECVALLAPFNGVLKFDYQRELAALVGYQTAEQRTAHLKYMAETYQTVPGGKMIPVYQGTDHLPQPEGQTPEIFKAPPRHDEIMAYMRLHPGLQYEEAKAKIVAG